MHCCTTRSHSQAAQVLLYKLINQSLITSPRYAYRKNADLQDGPLEKCTAHRFQSERGTVRGLAMLMFLIVVQSGQYNNGEQNTKRYASMSRMSLF